MSEIFLIWLDWILYSVWNIFTVVGFNSVHCLKYFLVINNYKRLLFATRAFLTLFFPKGGQSNTRLLWELLRSRLPAAPEIQLCQWIAPLPRPARLRWLYHYWLRLWHRLRYGKDSKQNPELKKLRLLTTNYEVFKKNNEKNLNVQFQKLLLFYVSTPSEKFLFFI